jgi:hypothetical protein
MTTGHEFVQERKDVQEGSEKGLGKGRRAAARKAERGGGEEEEEDSII